jgi:FAD:protein FMN transferase
MSMKSPPRPAVSNYLFPFLISLLLSGCGEEPVQSRQAYVFGTLVEISIQGEEKIRAQTAMDHVLKEFDSLHRELHAWKPGTLESLNTAIAQGKTFSLPPYLETLLKQASQLSERSGELFNPAIGELVRLWGFHSDTFEPRLPDRESVDKVLTAHPRMTDIVIKDGSLFSRNRAVRLDLGGYAKGYALDLAASWLKSQGIKNALINIGGNVLALGRHGNRPWRVGIQHPRRSDTLATLELHDGEAIATSGDYQRYFEVNGRRYCHIIDPRTGFPADQAQAVTVIAPPGPHAGALSDAASKPPFILGTPGWKQAVKNMGIRDALLVDKTGRIHVTESLYPRLKWTYKSESAIIEK